MKKITFILLVLWMAVMSGCSRRYSIKTIDYSDSISILEHKKETTEYDIEIYIDEKEPKEALLKTNLGELKGKYFDTTKTPFHTIKSYMLDTKDVIDIDETGKVVRYVWSDRNKDTSTLYTQDECVEKAKLFLKDYIIIDDYAIEVTRENDSYIVNCCKYVQGVKTDDYAYVRIDQYGNMGAFVSGYLVGMINKDVKLDFDFDEIRSQVIQKLDKEYELLKKQYDFTYEIEFTIVLIRKNKYALICETNTLFKSKDNSNLQMGDKMKFLIK